VKLRVVGIEALLEEGNGGGSVRMSAAFYRSHPLVGVIDQVAAVRLRRGPLDLPALQRDVARLYPTGSVYVQPLHPLAKPLIDAFGLNGDALWLLSVAAAIAALVITAPTLVRRTADACSIQSLLRTLG